MLLQKLTILVEQPKILCQLLKFLPTTRFDRQHSVKIGSDPIDLWTEGTGNHGRDSSPVKFDHCFTFIFPT